MVARAGIEPATQGFSVLCSTDWATEPLFLMAVPTGLEPAISSVTDWHVNHYTMEPFYGCGGRTWTNDLRVMSPTSYQLLYSAIYKKWRRKRDSNPRGALTPCRFSRPIPSARLGYFSVYICWYLIGGPCRTRTYDRPVMSRMLWPTELRVLVSHEFCLKNGSGGGTWTPDLSGMNRAL